METEPAKLINKDVIVSTTNELNEEEKDLDGNSNNSDATPKRRPGRIERIDTEPSEHEEEVHDVGINFFKQRFPIFYSKFTYVIPDPEYFLTKPYMCIAFTIHGFIGYLILFFLFILFIWAIYPLILAFILLIRILLMICCCTCSLASAIDVEESQRGSEEEEHSANNNEILNDDVIRNVRVQNNNGSDNKNNN